MTLPSHQQLMLSEIVSSNPLSPAHLQTEREHANKLLMAGFTTAGFLHLWIVTEVAAKELMAIYKYTKETHDALKKMGPELNRALRPHITASSQKEAHAQAGELTANALPSLVRPLQGIFKSHAQNSCRQLDISVIKAAFQVLAQPVDSERLEYLLATKVTDPPAGIGLTDKITVRERRNKLVHSNGSVDAATVMQLLPIFDVFFNLLQQISAQIHQEQDAQHNLNNEVAQ
ncbi:hypothetical protein [Aeromonas veronii]|uniref:hypothetical protein n=1 Tax=Aeromonas veronii TaxID=654 RepID=UPI003D216B24